MQLSELRGSGGLESGHIATSFSTTKEQTRADASDQSSSNRPFDPAQCELLAYAHEGADVFFINYDMSEHMLSRANMAFQGVTVPPPGFSKAQTPESVRNARFFLAFRGTSRNGYFDSSTVRPHLLAAFMNNTRDDVAVEFLGIPKWHVPDDKARFLELLNSSYSLVPHGDGRWNYRFNDVIAACSIPVIMSDNLTLPYDQLIDWGQAAIRIDEAYGRSEQEVLDRLPTDAATIQRMRERVCEIHRRYFATQALRLDALLEAAAKAADGKQIDRGPVCG